MLSNTPSRSALRSPCDKLIRPRLTSRSRLDTVALSGARRDLPRLERTPALHRRRIYAASPWSRELRGHVPARPGWQRLLSGSCSSARSFDPRFLPTLGRPHAVALHFTRCDQLVTGLAPVRVRPCWAHMENGCCGSRNSRSRKSAKGFWNRLLALRLRMPLLHPARWSGLPERHPPAAFVRPSCAPLR